MLVVAVSLYNLANGYFFNIDICIAIGNNNSSCLLYIHVQEAEEKALDAATAVIESGGVIALPTDTVYGIAASVSSDEAILKLYSIKGRQKNKPIAICVSDVEDINK